MAVTNNALYSPYGAYELKAKYQRNFLTATGLAVSLVLVILLTVWIIQAIRGHEEIFSAPTVIKTIAELGPPPTIVQKPPQVKVTQPNVAVPKVGIPTPVADESAPDDDVVLATREELALIVPPDISAGGDGNIQVDINEEDYLPAAGEFVAVEQQPEMISEVKPDYPRLAKQAGLEGKVYVMALVDREGNVRDAKVAKSSGSPQLDEAAVKAALLCKYKPAIQNGRPVACWVTYKVDFILNESGN
jgi:protein TonB